MWTGRRTEKLIWAYRHSSERVELGYMQLGLAAWAFRVYIFMVYDDIVKQLIRNVIAYPPDHTESDPRKHDKNLMLELME
jgi:hypothetical protein